MRSVPPFVLSVEQPEQRRQHNADNDARNQGEVECTAIALDDVSPGSRPRPIHDRIGHTIPITKINKPNPINKRCTSIAGTLLRTCAVRRKTTCLEGLLSPSRELCRPPIRAATSPFCGSCIN